MITQRKISLFFATFLVISGMAFGQKINEKSRLNIGQSAKKLNFSTSTSTNPLLKANLPNQLAINAKPSFTQFYRDLLITKHNNQKAESVDKGEKITMSNIYPNPAVDYASVDYKVQGNYGEAYLTFYNLLGKEVANFELSPNADKVKINTSTWESGIYMYQLIVDDKKLSTKKLIIRHN